jgi:uncharacterized protein (TIGR02147 family)
MPSTNPLRLYSYLNYRDYLRDYFASRKKLYLRFSYRYFSLLAGYNSSGLIINITKGKKNVGPGILDKISKAMGHNRKETEYFKALIHFNQAKTTAEKNKHFERLLYLIRGKGTTVEARQFRYFSKWYYPAVRELLAIIKFKGDYKEITGRIKPTISFAQAQNAIRTLLRYGFIKKDRFGCYRPVDKYVTSGSRIKSLAIDNFQRAMMDLAKDAADRFPSEEREISTLTFSASKEALKEMKEEIQRCRANLVEIIKKSRKMDTVGQMNFQLFPLTK